MHGDLHPANVVVSDGTLAGIVDFGDLLAGDPAWDLAAAWVLLPAGTASGSSTPTHKQTRRRSGAPAAWPL
ncbi:phosphotransferase [Actinomadura rupiterrae]|uniref:phosphotransferase n=1 Tax=Actinomadura rupiterrae TaxID=559627 RepID=UPI0020A332B6|nr:phosphotransferase [Actinomadura rupiterrae]MCP2342258.1 aminoglycoside phosphotransferase (APT) family kinase protein [Actinomadura rupiterrae]